MTLGAIFRFVQPDPVHWCTLFILRAILRAVIRSGQRPTIPITFSTANNFYSNSRFKSLVLLLWSRDSRVFFILAFRREIRAWLCTFLTLALLLLTARGFNLRAAFRRVFSPLLELRVLRYSSLQI